MARISWNADVQTGRPGMPDRIRATVSEFLARRAAADPRDVAIDAVLAGLPDLVVLVDPSTRRIEYANRAVEALGWAPDELAGMHVERLIPAIDALEPDTEGLTRSVMSPSGVALPVDVRSTSIVLPSGAARHLVTARDATQRLESELRLVRLAAAERSHVRSLEAVIRRSEERRVGKECRSRWSPYH